MKHKTIAKAIVIIMILTTLLTIGLGIAWIATEISNSIHDRYDVNRDGYIDVADCLTIQKKILESD